MTPQISKTLHQIVVDFRAWSGIADDEALVGYVTPTDVVKSRQSMTVWESQENALAPEVGCIATIP
ncbi:hypothetical protein AA0535_1582 [Asaia krungthepensis NRIC 0535]|uniref:Uncharacterized protein n=1 Tax=Asaia krungthepensis NRIC 0535 TaxID=1307925 RepID=A0ABQ0Q2R5_9PROT|nr:hypothetical protein AA0535_1582 [Asaia krungthepensis NRIC 0535]